MADTEPETKYIVNAQPVLCGYTLSSARCDRNELVLGLMKATAPPGWIMRSEAETLADAIIAATDNDVVPVLDGVPRPQTVTRRRRRSRRRFDAHS